MEKYAASVVRPKSNHSAHPFFFIFSSFFFPFLRRRSQNTALFCLAHQAFPFIPSSSLFQQSLAAIRQDLQLSAFNALQPVPEASANARE
jgi:hypothetical protein